jgi:DNA-binding CsgD family transcriptional regulator
MANLTKREKEVVSLLAQGKRPKEIARELVISRHTVYAHVQNARRATQTGSAFELAVKAAAELRQK